MQTMNVKWNVLDVLSEAKVQGNSLVFAQEYDRKIYEETQKGAGGHRRKMESP